MAEPNIKPGQPIDAWTAEAYREIVARIKDRQNLSVVAPLFLRQGTSTVLGISNTQGFYAKLSGSTSPYSFTEQYGAASGAWADMVRTGTTNAYEVNGVASLNNKVVWVEPGYPGEYLFQYVGSAGSCATATVNTGTISCNGTLTSITWDLRDAADTTTLATATGTSASFTGVAGATGYKVRATKAGYHTKTSATVTAGCGATVTASVTTWPTTYNFTLNAFVAVVATSCGLPNATVSITGDATGSGTTNSSGNVVISLSSTSTSVTQNLNVTITPASGHGAAVLTYSVSINACTPTTQNKTLTPASGCVAVLFGPRYMPDTLSYVDDHGSGTATWSSGTGWQNSYTYSAFPAIDNETCPGPVVRKTPDHTANVSALYALSGGNACGNTNWTMSLQSTTEQQQACAGGAFKCQPVADAAASALYQSLNGASITGVSSSSSISFSFTVPNDATTGCAGGATNTGVNAVWTGTIP